MEITIKNVRLAFENLFEPSAFAEGQEKKFGATFLIPKNSPEIKKIESAIQEVAEEKWAKKADEVLDMIRGDNQKFCFQDGDHKSKKNLDGFAGHYALSCKNPKRPTLVDRSGAPVQKGEPQCLYDGCYVLAKVEIWAQNNQHGKGIRATVNGVQFMKDGDSFSAARVSSVDEFEDLSDGADDEALM